MKISAVLFFLIISWNSICYSQEKASDLNIVFQDVCWSSDSKSILYSYIVVKKDWSDFNMKNWKIGRTWIKKGKTKTILENAINVSISNDGGSIVFSSNRDGNDELYLQNLDSKEIKRLTTNDFRDNAPKFSPDGEWIAFNSDRSGNVEIYLMKNDGSDITQLTHSEGHKAFNPSWSPNGKQIVYYLEKGDNKDQIHFFDLEEKTDRALTSDSLNNIYPTFTSDGKIIYGANKKGEQSSLKIIEAQNGELIDFENIQAFYAQQSPDGKKLAYITSKPEKAIFLSDADGKNQKPFVTKDLFIKN